MCISIKNLLALENADSPSQKLTLKNEGIPVVYERMIVVEIEGNTWVFKVDEIDGVHRCKFEDLEEVPAIVSKATETYTNGVFRIQERKINYLDHELLFYSLKRRIL